MWVNTINHYFKPWNQKSLKRAFPTGVQQAIQNTTMHKKHILKMTQMGITVNNKG